MTIETPKKKIAFIVVTFWTSLSLPLSSHAALRPAFLRQDIQSTQKRKQSTQKDHGHPIDLSSGKQPKTINYQGDSGGYRQKTGKGGGGGDGQPPKTGKGGGGGDGQPPKTGKGGGGGDWTIVPAVGGAVVGSIVLAKLLHDRNPEHKFHDNGPQIDSQLSMSGFMVKAFVRAEWPVVLDFELPKGGEVVLTVRTGDASQEYRFASTNARRQEIVTLPSGFGNKPKPGLYYIRAESPGTAQPAYLRLYGLGAGEEAVGSVGIDELRFGPERVRKSAGVTFGFHSHSDFNSVVVEFVRSGLFNGQLINNLDGKMKMNGATENETKTGTWDTKKAKSGDHLLRVRAWRHSTFDWVIAWSTDLVEIEE